MKNILVTGGAGYVGAVLVPKLLARGYNVKVIDWYIYGEDVLRSVEGHPGLTQIKGDIRDQALLEREMPGTDAIIHLACISNDPSYELNPALGKSVNYDAFLPLVRIAKDAKVRRFVFASSSSVYGIKDEPEVTEVLPLKPLTDYSRYKALCEEILLKEQREDFTVLILRPATVCGFSTRLRLDLTVNILTNHAVNTGRIKVFGGRQQRPNIHIEDMTDLYVRALEFPAGKIAGRIFNVGYQNHTVDEIAQIVKNTVGHDRVEIEHVSTDDNRSYRISSKKILSDLGFAPRHSIEQACADLKQAFEEGRVPKPMEDNRYYNIRMMQALSLK
ncbi:MAG: SDR family oxidoreductase [Candidatus Omnitrophota bacterium]|jgi:nucleoside-diphosphate-sugar epimerase